VFDGSRLLSEGELVSQLEKILNNSEPQEEPVGILTTADRSVWAKQRKRLLKGAYFTLHTIHNSYTHVICINKDRAPIMYNYYDRLYFSLG